MKIFKTFEVEYDDSGILTVILNRPEKLNAINGEMVTELLQLIDEIERGYPEKYRVVILRGAGRGFCSGGDLEDFQRFLGEETVVLEKYISQFQWLSQRWYELPLPTIACLHGPVAGGGASFSLLCDIRLASDNTDIRFLFSNIGLISDMGAHYTLPALLGNAKALELMYLGSAVSANEALRLGLVNHVLPMDKLEQIAMNIAEQLANGPAGVYKISKYLVQNGSDKTLSNILAKEVFHQAKRFKSPEFLGAVQQFLK